MGFCFVLFLALFCMLLMLLFLIFLLLLGLLMGLFVLLVFGCFCWFGLDWVGLVVFVAASPVISCYWNFIFLSFFRSLLV